MVHGIHGTHGKLRHAEATFSIRGACFEVYRTLGAGFLEAVYQESLALEFQRQQIPFKETPSLALSYKGDRLRHTYAPDFVCFEQVIVELKALRTIAPEHRAQVMNYLKASGLEIGLLVNFGSTEGVQIERFAL
jgi:GxxExxY protein